MKNPFDDTLPEEGEHQYKELTTLLQQAYSKPVSVTPERQAQILARVRERLGTIDQEAPLNGKPAVPQPGVLDSSSRQAASPAGKPHRDKQRLRLMALLAAALIVVLLLSTPLLLRSLLLSTSGDDHTNGTPAGAPTLTLSPNVAVIGSTVQLTLKNFTPNTRVALTHDVQEPISIEGGSSIIGVGPSGAATVNVYIGSDWAIGFDQIYAEDLATHYTASAQLQVVGHAAQTYDSFVATYGIMSGFDAQHTHFNPFEHILTPTTVGRLTKKWIYHPGGAVFSTPAVADGVVYFGCSCGYLYAFDAATGAEKWAYSTGGSQVTDDPAVVDGVVYVGSAENHTFYALDAVTGKKKWAYQTRGPISNSSPVVVGGVVYIGSEDNNVYALDAATGAKKWASSIGHYIDSSPAVADGVVYIGSDNNNVYALDAATGAKKWVFHTGNGVDSSPAVVDGVVYVSSYDGNVYALDAATGAKKWASLIGHYIGSSPAVADGVVYIGSDNNNVYALDAATGAKEWAFHTGSRVYATPMVAGDVVYVGSGDGNLYALDAATGAKEWAFHTGGAVDIAPAVADGVIYLNASGAYVIYAFHLPGS